MEQQLQHFSHPEHPLVFNQDDRGGDICCGCGERVSGPSYSCKEWWHWETVHHKSCAELPLGLHHPLHPIHPLILFSPERYENEGEGEGEDDDDEKQFFGKDKQIYKCELCKDYKDVYTYRCARCDFNLHITCASLAPTMDAECHHHPLTPFWKWITFTCDLCGKEDKVTCDIRQELLTPVAVLFSGGLDSMILSALLDECVDPSYEIDLLNVSFDSQFAPDRISAKAGVMELRRIAPLRRWKLVEIDADLSTLDLETKHVMSLINPANTYMDLNIGIALWLAARGSGWVYEGNNNNCDEDLQCNERVKYKSKARIVLVGSGADEQCAGYGRHKTKYRKGSWLGLHEEMKLDMQRIWKRNLGRDDRCIADNGKEARFPFLDEDVIRTLLDIPLWEIANLDQPSGIGDKKILREVAQLLGLYEAAVLPKRAIQFGSRIARESNQKNFGSNRAASQASAGSAVIQLPSNLT
ncbi:uncharacterized protein LOC112039846 isoform X1 [Quercus suber]|uniref:uncharacterized protein LOC112039846 isoform X1 n=1 Tax=Quercus suber TaxID=58331 RepID=UPI0032DFCBF8